MKDINLLRNDTNHLKREVTRLNHQNQPSVIYFPNPCTPGLVAVSNLLGCPILLVTRISPKSIKTKIPKSCLYKAMQSSAPTSHLVYVWKNRTSRPSTNNSSSLPSQKLSDSIQIATWNCRGLHNSIPYIKNLISTGLDILVLQEHWLCPFELSELDSIDSNFFYTATCDSRLSSTSTLTRGCGGCAILLRKSLPAVATSNLNSDRICSIQVAHALSPSLVLTCPALTNLKSFTTSTSPPSIKPFLMRHALLHC